MTNSSWFVGTFLVLTLKVLHPRQNHDGWSPHILEMRMLSLKELRYLLQLVLQIQIQVCLEYGTSVLTGQTGIFEKKKVGLSRALW